MTGRFALALAALLLLTPSRPGVAQTFVEPPVLAEDVAAGRLPPVAERLPRNPSVVDFGAEHKEPGQYGGTLTMIMGRDKDTRQMVVYGYARLVVYRPKTYELVPDLAAKVDVQDDRVFTFTLREGHRWSDGQPFTTEDFRYFWHDVANNPALSPTGPPSELMVDGEAPTVEILSPTVVRYSWSKPNPEFLPALAGASPLYLYRPAHYLKTVHGDYADPAELEKRIKSGHQRNWAALHNKLDNMYKFDNPALPTLQPWMAVTEPPSDRFVYRRNPYYHRVDAEGRQLPYIDEAVFQVAAPGLIPAKTGAGESALQARYLSFDDYTFLRQSETRSGYETYLWRTAYGAHLALFPNMNAEDPVWRALMRDVRFRRALSLAINRHEINEVIYYGLALDGADTLLPTSPLYREGLRERWASYSPKSANALLDEIGLTKRDSRGVRLLPDGRPAEIVVETAGESTEQTDVLELIHDGWMAAGIKLYSRPTQRTVFRNRVFAGKTLMAISSGTENGLATAETSPQAFAPTDQIQYMWPKWGQYYQTGGKAGEKPDLPEASRLMELYRSWRSADSPETRTLIWAEMLDIWSEQVYSIGLIAGVLQPVVVDLELHNVPVQGVYAWDPGAHFGIYRPDTFFFGPARPRTPESVLTAAVRSRR
ncbi:ABC transporter substrate-binding protein [Thalassobaculum sp.]|uniref:ABC transporter substrate-binding protein n=1 Tax=Thalassobaculum sp. TaxID=2022740 RepID=UPI0032F00EC9